MLWNIELLGRLRAKSSGRVIDVFKPRKVGGLLGYLAYHLGESQPRETLVDEFWGDVDPENGRLSLRNALTHLRRQLEPLGIEPGTVLIADRATVRLNLEAVTTDILTFRAELKRAERVPSLSERLCHLKAAIGLYRGPLLYGEDFLWLLTERPLMRAAYLEALSKLITALEGENELERALHYAQQAIADDQTNEGFHLRVLRLLLKLDRAQEAKEQYQHLERILKAQLNEAPSEEARAFAARLPDALPSNIRSDRRQEAPTPAMSPLPPSTSAAAAEMLRGNLPLQFNTFYGRQEEMARLEALLRNGQTRLVTLTGFGGTGKTRLAIETARRLHTAFPGGIWFVSLVALTEPRLIVTAIRDALRLPATAGGDPQEQVVAAFSGEPSLLILDNFEQIAAGGGPIILGLLRRALALVCLVTSRRRLHLSGEIEFPVGLLPMPDTTLSPTHLLDVASVQLFKDRAQAAWPVFEMTSRNAADVAELCRCLEGIPLAIELAATWIPVLSPAQIPAKLARPLGLHRRKQGRAGRHNALRAVLEESYHLLPPMLQRLFARLSVFRGGWSAEAAELVCAEPAVLEYLTQLRTHSLILVEDGGAEVRFGMLETLRVFAAEQLEPPERDATAERHARWFLEQAEAAASEWTGPNMEAWLARLRADQNNLRAALEWCLTSPEWAGMGLQLAGALWRFWYADGRLDEGRELLRGALEAAEPVEARARTLAGAGVLAYSQGDYPAAQSLLEECLKLRREQQDTVGIAQAVNYLGNVAIYQADYPAARACYEESLALMRVLGEELGIANALGNLGNVAFAQDDYAAARSLYAENVELRRRLADPMTLSYALFNLGMVALSQSDLSTARAALEESLAIQQRLDDTWGAAYSRNGQGQLAMAEGNLAEARSLLKAAVETVRNLKDENGLAQFVNVLGELEMRETHWDAAAACQRESLAVSRRLGDKKGISAALEGMARRAASQGQISRAATLFGAAESLRTAIGTVEASLHDNAVLERAAASDPAAWERALARGRAMTLEQSIAYALQAGQPDRRR